MKSRLGMIVVLLLAYAAFNLYQSRSTAKATESSPVRGAKPAPSIQCDGREYCSQMTSCAEAKFFIQNCPNTKMDGDRDGVPCEKQWCGR